MALSTEFKAANALRLTTDLCPVSKLRKNDRRICPDLHTRLRDKYTEKCSFYMNQKWFVTLIYEDSKAAMSSNK